MFTSVFVEPKKEVPHKHQDTSRRRRRKIIGNRSTLVPAADDECPRSEAKGTNHMLPTGPVLRLEDSTTLLRWSSEGCEVGPHKGALSEIAIHLVHNDVEYQVKVGFAVIYFWVCLEEVINFAVRIQFTAYFPLTL